MISIIKKSLTAALVFSCSASVLAQRPHAPAKQKEYDKKVAAAMPSLKVAVKPKKARRVLVLSKTAGWYHSSIETGNTCYREMAAQTGAFSVEINNDPSFYTSDNLAKYDAILFSNTAYCQDYFNDKQRAAILNYVKNGGGFIGIHAASDCGTSAKKGKSTWPEITEMIGGAFDGHPWNRTGTYGILNEDPSHPIVAPLSGKGLRSLMNFTSIRIISAKISAYFFQLICLSPIRKKVVTITITLCFG